ncbi:MAG: site-specific integrase [Vicinamibacterales bacterium]
MAVFQRPGRKVWWFEFEYRGRRYRESAGTRSKTLAMDIERKRRRDVEESANGIRRNKGAAVLFSVAASDWLSLKKPTWADKTYIIETANVGHLRPHFGKLLLTDITDHDIARYQEQRREEKAANKTINNEVAALRAVLRRHRLWAQIAPDVRMLRVREDVGRALAVEEEERLLRACAASRSRSLLPAVTLALNTGLRHDELRLMTWRQVDLVNDAVTVGVSKTEHGAGRAVPLNARAIKAMTAWAQEFPDRKPRHYVFPSEKVGVAGNDRIASVFDTMPDRPISSWKVAWTTAREKAVVSCRFHDLRHTTVTRLLERGVAFAIVATIMGWSPATSVRMAKRYGHIGASPQREAMQRLDAPYQPTQEAPAADKSVH